VQVVSVQGSPGLMGGLNWYTAPHPFVKHALARRISSGIGGAMEIAARPTDGRSSREMAFILKVGPRSKA
jgi:hypothetical protein